MPDFRSDPSESAEGRGIARRAWESYAVGLRKSTRPVFDPLAAVWSRKITEDLLGFWVLWHVAGGFEGLERYGMHKTTIWRKVKKFRMILGSHPDEYKFPGITIDAPLFWGALDDDIARRSGSAK